MDFTTRWGAGIGWNLNQPVLGDFSPVSVAEFSGVTFTHVAAVTVQTRFVVNVGTTGYCKTIPAGENTVEWTQLNSACWDGTGVDFDPETTMVDSLAWQIVTKEGAPTPFDFCIGGLTFIGGGGAPGD